MRKISPKLLIRRFVLATSFPPFLQMYRFLYEMVIRIALRMFKRYPAVKAVYLRRGGAKGEILPLISDVDFAVIGERMNEEDRKELLQGYDRLAKATTLLDQTLEVYDEDTFHKHYKTNDYFQYRFMEGKETWKLLYGKDYTADLPALSFEKMYGGFYTEIKIWWTLFAWRFFQARKYNDEGVTRNNACYKTVSEILKMNLALNHGTLEFDRREALRRSKSQFNGKEEGFPEKLEGIAKKRFRSSDDGILDETKDFLLTYLDRFYGEFRNHPHARPLKDVTQRVDCPKDEWFQTDEEHAHVTQLVHYAKENWPHTYLGAHLVSSAYFNVDELLLMIEVNPKRLPTVRELTEFNLFHQKAQPQLKDRFKLFLLLPNAAFQIDPDDFKKSWQTILCPPCNPDLFELVSRPEFTLDGRGHRPTVNPAWTPLVEHFFREEKMLFYELLENPSVYKLNSLDFLRIFWKTVQLVIMNRSARNDKILYPLTLQAIERDTDTEGIPLPSQLKTLAHAYRDELKGRSVDIARSHPKTV